MAIREPRRRRVMAQSSGHAHADIYKSDSKCALVLGIHRATANRYKKDGGRLRELADYVENAPDPFRIKAHLESWMIQKKIKDLSNTDLFALYHKTLMTEPGVEGDDRTLDMTPGACWLNRARASERDSAINAKKAAIEREFAARGITESEVRG